MRFNTELEISQDEIFVKRKSIVSKTGYYINQLEGKQMTETFNLKLENQ